ncbi:LLM class F420-dependent oxidoreductase [Micromonospora aurantiaca]|uniref:LLM class F420-dependent oxidoreductase n=1 Tax=Micromonospora aurantiaca (nom. illeg.) TaxID=47850 RepID=A0A3M9KU87_9ACTN|nr:MULTISPECIES: LLM class F420-dependent oxidoreductase [Micromonospora]ADL48985.1 putative F420-dependent oxidoreductase [Micromonospora aurantiaca ATCC 27029]AXH94350.1 LLM class F420-dependent oxidoreductase [Micromonospora aurantiaca]KAB1117042.1 LLM class F420-dependent oxidoreductase [Micromonospora aurantiaca]MBC9005303.1 LLM class F420-dependent oxidoreductase [Micromonospora aurantiaca]MDW3850238.1 LLM class F420-dependent oxidoreductase [Micromonospora sp. BRA006-A]
MRVSVFTEPHRGADYDDQLRFARLVEETGFEGFFRADHYRAMGDEPALPGPTDAWLTLAALARETSRIRLGTLVTSATFRLPGPLAVMVAQVDRMSGGRVELGIGAGWYEREHTAYGIPFPPVSERFDRLAEQLEIVTGLWRTPSDETYSFTGEHYRLVDAPALPKPVQQPGPPVIVGGRGPKRTPELAARYADEFNMPFKSVAETAAAYERVREACDRAGRDASGRAPLTLSAGIVVAIGRTDAEAQRRAAPLHVTSALPPEDPVVGSPAQLVDRIGEFAAIGATRVHLRLIDFDDLDHVELIAAEVLPRLDGPR